MIKPHFIWKEQSSLEFGIIIEKIPPRIKPELKGEIIDIPGRNGTLFESEDTYKSKMVEIECTLIPQGTVENLLMQLPLWLDGFGKLILSDYQNFYYEAKIINAIPIERLFKRYRKFKVIFEVQPFAKSIEEYQITKTTTTEEEININSYVRVSPILEIDGEGDIDIHINNQIIHLKDVTDKITIDCEFMNATTHDGTVNANNKVLGLPLTLKPGANIISIDTENDITLTIKYRSLWI